MQLHDVSRAGGMMQPVDVLRDDPVQHARLLKRGHRPVPGVGPRGDDSPPADVSAGPVALTSLRRSAELSDRHRQPSAERAARTAIVRDARLSRQARARQHAHTPATHKLTKPARHHAIHRLSIPATPPTGTKDDDSDAPSPPYQQDPPKRTPHVTTVVPGRSHQQQTDSAPENRDSGTLGEKSQQCSPLR